MRTSTFVTMARLLLFLWALVGVSWACPHKCRCSLDERGRRGVLCEEGEMGDPLPVSGLRPDTEVLVISAPPSRPNAFTLGPIFKRLRQLEEIHITHSKIPALGAHSFWGLHRLHVLNLTHNQISALMDTNFKGADSLRHLDLSNNRIQSVPSAVFRYVRHLRSLTLAHNLVPDLVSRIFFGLTRLERLDLSHNPILDLQPERFTDVPELRHLYCAGCHLSSISTSLLQTLPLLHELDLRDNRLTQVPLGMASSMLPNLVKLRLDGNHISFIERGAISGSPLTTLGLAHNRISRVEPHSFANSTVKHLDLSYNRLSQLNPSALHGILHQLHDLQLSGNSLQVEQLVTVLPKASQLHRLGLGDMGLTNLPPDLFEHSPHLHQLNLSANYLTSFSTEILQNTKHLHSLDLSLNNFRGLDSAFFDSVTRARELRTLRLEGNPWLCDQCHAGPLLRWLQDAPDQESGCAEPRVWSCLRCKGPQGVAGLQLGLLPLGDLPACPFTTPAAVAIMPTWIEPSLSVNTEEPAFPRSDLTRQADAEQGWGLNGMVREELYLVVSGGVLLVVLLLILVVIGVVVYNKHSASYYTHETDPEKKERLMKGNNSNNNTNTPVKTQLDATIATIDEMTNIAGSHEVLEDNTDSSLNHITNMPPADTSITLTSPDVQPTQPPDLNQTQHHTQSPTHTIELCQIQDNTNQTQPTVHHTTEDASTTQTV